MKIKTSLLTLAAASLIALGLFVFTASHPVPRVHAGSGGTLSGWAWSDTIGWISFNSADANTGSSVNYGVTVDPTTGNLDGDAWSSNVGWISFDNSANTAGGSCPSGTCQANIGSNGQVTGWARVLSEVGSTDGYDGWISLNSANSSGSTASYGVTFDPTSGSFSGYAWGGNGTAQSGVITPGVIGWIQFNASSGGPGSPGVTCTGTCPTGETNTDSITISVTASPSSINSGGSSTISWSSDLTSSNPSATQTCSGSWDGQAANFSNPLNATASGSFQTSPSSAGSHYYTLSCYETGQSTVSQRQTATLTVNNPGGVTLASCSPSDITTPGSYYVGDTVQWTATASGGTPPYKYSWTFNPTESNVTGASSADPQVVYSTTGTKEAFVNITDANGQTLTNPPTQCGTSINVSINPIFIEY